MYLLTGAASELTLDLEALKAFELLWVRTHPEYQAMLANLTETQARGMELIDEARAARGMLRRVIGEHRGGEYGSKSHDAAVAFLRDQFLHGRIDHRPVDCGAKHPYRPVACGLEPGHAGDHFVMIGGHGYAWSPARGRASPAWRACGRGGCTRGARAWARSARRCGTTCGTFSPVWRSSRGRTTGSCGRGLR